MNEYYEGQIFEKEYPPEVAKWCNNNQEFYIKEIESIEREEPIIDPTTGQETGQSELKIIRRFQIQAVPAPTEEEQKQARIAELERYLADTDWYAVRHSETGKPVPPDIAQKRQEARDEISRLRGDTINDQTK